MLLTPRYGTDPVIHLDGDAAAIGVALIRQRRRFADGLRELTDDEWTRPSRCDDWSVRDVAVHVSTTNAFWEASIRAGVAGTPTMVMAGFDPVASPALTVAASEQSIDEIVEIFSTSNESLAECIGELSAGDWELLAESPPGHVTASTVAHHALWDSWVHERDIMLPLGRVPDEEPDEIASSLRYLAGFTPALALNAGEARSGGFDVVVTGPELGAHVEIGTDVWVTDGVADADFTLTGSAVELLEALSFRVPLTQSVPDAIAWAFAGLATVFDH